MLVKPLLFFRMNIQTDSHQADLGSSSGSGTFQFEGIEFVPRVLKDPELKVSWRRAFGCVKGVFGEQGCTEDDSS